MSHEIVMVGNLRWLGSGLRVTCTCGWRADRLVDQTRVRDWWFQYQDHLFAVEEAA